MDPRLRLALAALGAAIVLGILGDALLRAFPWGLNAPLWLLAVLGVVLWLVRRGGVEWKGEGRWLLIAAALAAGGMAWRDSQTLKLLSLTAALTALALAAARSRVGRIVVAGVADYVVAALSAAVHAVLGFVLLLLGDVRWEVIPREGGTRRVLAVGRGLAIAVPVLLLFTGLFMAADAAFEGIVNALFLAFVVVQLRYLFGGASLVALSPGLTYAEYARRGFFELVTVAALVLPLLLAADWLATTVLRGRPERFAFGALAAGFLLLAVLDVLDPDALIARVNAQRAAAGKAFDAAYASSLSADGVPALVAALPRLGPAERCVVARVALARWSRPSNVDWRTWSVGRARAWSAVRENEDLLRASLCPPPRS